MSQRARLTAAGIPWHIIQRENVSDPFLSSDRLSNVMVSGLARCGGAGQVRKTNDNAPVPLFRTLGIMWQP